MAELFIDRWGEVRLVGDVVGTIQWSGPCAFHGVTGEWDRDTGDSCYCCGGSLASAEDLEEVEDERDELKDELEKATDKIEKLTREIQTLRGSEVVSDE